MEQVHADLAEIVHLLVEGHGCHAVILYGSRARGDFEASSDWDVAGIRETGEPRRLVRELHGAWLDAFVYPESQLAKLDADTLRFLGGRIVVDQRGYASALLERVAALEKQGPPKLPQDDDDMLRGWYAKMLVRVARLDLEAKYRRAWLLFQALEDYFKLRGRWYRGPKESFSWLAGNDPESHAAFTRALEPGASTEDLRALVARVLARTGC